MNKKVYSSSLKKTTFVYLFSKKIAKKMKNGIIYNDLYKYFVDERHLDIISDQRRSEVFNVVYQRLILLDDFLLTSFLDNNLTTSKFILLYSIALSDPLFLEFLLICYRETITGNKKYLSTSDFDDFFLLMKEKNTVVAQWSNTTIKQLSGGYRNILVESGIGYRKRKNIYTNKFIIDPSVIKHIEDIGGSIFLQAVMGVY